jgi:hypothetical protein
MLNFHINRSGSGLSSERRRELRKAFGKRRDG